MDEARRHNERGAEPQPLRSTAQRARPTIAHVAFVVAADVARPMHDRDRTEGRIVDALTVRAHRDFAELAGVEAELEGLNASSRRPTLFLTLAFLRTAWEHEEYVREGRRPLLLTAWEGERLIGFLPLRTATERAFGIPCKVVELLITHDQDRPFVIAAPDDEARCAAAFFRYLLEREPGWSALRFMAQDASSKLHPPPIPLSRLRYQVRWRACRQSPPPHASGSDHLTRRQAPSFARERS